MIDSLTPIFTAVLPWASLVLGVVALPVWLYLFTLTALAWRKKPPAPPSDDQAPLLVCVVPAHNETDGIAATVKSLLDAEYPPTQKRVFVVADNCSDQAHEGGGTADRARAAGAVVMERQDDVKRGKGFALEAGFEKVLEDKEVGGIIVVDADTVVANNLWRAVAARVVAGDLAMQVTNAVRNPDAGWRPRLQAIAMAMINGVRSLGRERMGVSCGLRGTGMAFSRACLERVPHKVYGVVEDVEYGVRLGMNGIRVAFAPETWIRSDAPVNAKTALSQRRRWEGGRLSLMKTLMPKVLAAAVAQRSRILFDLACDLSVPPISYPALLVVLGAGIEGALFFMTGAPSFAWPIWAFEAFALAAYVLRGVAFSGTGVMGLVALATAPAYIAWKIVVARPWKRSDGWVRTRRVSEEQADL